MILFRDDWNKYPTAIADYNTKNESFVRLSLLFKEMGIKNNEFFLALINPNLRGIDPFDPNLTLEEIAAVTVECKINFWYFLREIAKAPSIAGGGSIPIRANRGNIALYWLFFNHITTMLIQIRQTGKSFSTDILMSYLLNIRCLNTQINLITKDDKLRSANIRRIKSIMSEFPFYLNQRSKKDSDNTENITIRRLGNVYNTHLPQQSPKAAENVGRGLSSPIVHADEAAYLYNIGISLPVALGSMTAAIDMAKMNNEPYGIILTTTVGKKDDRDGKFVYNLLSNSAIMSETFYDSENLSHVEDIIRKNSPKGELRVNCTYSHRQLGYSDAWLKEKIENIMGDKDTIRRDYFNEWTDGNASHPLPLNILTAMRESQKDVIYTEISNTGYITRWYIEKEEVESYVKNNQCILAIDPSDAGGGDDISLILLNITNGKVIAAGNYNETNLILFSEWVFQWFVRFDNIVGIIERRSSGASLLDYLILKMVAKDIDPFKRLFNRVVNDREEYPDRFKEINMPIFRRNREVYTKHKKHFGFATSGSGITSRTELYSTTLLSASKLIGHQIHDKTLIDQIAGLTTRNGRVDHQSGEHDDLVIAWLLSYWIISLGRNLEYYDINSKQILTYLKTENLSCKDPIEQYQIQEQLNIRDKIEEIYNLMINEKDDMVLKNYEHKVRFLSSKLILEDNESFSVDDFMKNIEDERKLKFVNKENYNNFPRGITQNSIREDLFTLSDPYYYRNF